MSNVNIPVPWNAMLLDEQLPTFRNVVLPSPSSWTVRHKMAKCHIQQTRPVSFESNISQNNSVQVLNRSPACKLFVT